MITCPLVKRNFQGSEELCEQLKADAENVWGCREGCAWYDEKKKQCCIKTLAQKSNNVSLTR